MNFFHESINYALDELMVSCVPSLAAKLHTAGLHSSCLGALKCLEADSLSSVDVAIDVASRRLLRVLYVLYNNEPALLSCHSYMSLFRTFWDHARVIDSLVPLSPTDKRTQSALSFMQAVIKPLMRQYVQFRLSFAGLMSAQLRTLSRNIRQVAPSGGALTTDSSRVRTRLTTHDEASRTATSSTVATTQNLTFVPSVTVGSPALSRFNLADYDWVGFDLDHTLITYNRKLFNAHMVKAAARCVLESAAAHARSLLGAGMSGSMLRDTFDAPVSQLSPGLRAVLLSHLLSSPALSSPPLSSPAHSPPALSPPHLAGGTTATETARTPDLFAIARIVDDAELMQRVLDQLPSCEQEVSHSMVFDTALGNLLQLSPTACVVAGQHGLTPMSSNHIAHIYGTGPVYGYATSEAAGAGLLDALRTRKPDADEVPVSARVQHSSSEQHAVANGEARFHTIQTGFDEALPLLLAIVVTRLDTWMSLVQAVSPGESSRGEWPHESTLRSGQDPVSLSASLPTVSSDSVSARTNDPSGFEPVSYTGDYTALGELLSDAMMQAFSRFCPFGVSAMWSDLAKYVEKKPETQKFLAALRNLPLPPRHPVDAARGDISATIPSTRRIKTFLLTNSMFEHVDSLMRFAIGEGWLNLFDLVMCEARKKTFFAKGAAHSRPSPFRALNPRTGKLEGRDNITWAPPASTLRHRNSGSSTEFGPAYDGLRRLNLWDNKVYSGGNVTDLMNTLSGYCFVGGTDHPSPVPTRQVAVCYVGDHVLQDIVAPATAGWDTVAVLPDLQVPSAGENNDAFLSCMHRPTLGVAQVMRTAALSTPSVETLATLFLPAIQAATASADHLNAHRIRLASLPCYRLGDAPRPASSGGIVHWLAAAFSRPFSIDPSTYTGIMGRCVRSCRATIPTIQRAYGMNAVSAVIKDAYTAYWASDAASTARGALSRTSIGSGRAGSGSFAAVSGAHLTSSRRPSRPTDLAEHGIWASVLSLSLSRPASEAALTLTTDLGLSNTLPLPTPTSGTAEFDDSISVASPEGRRSSAGCLPWRAKKDPTPDRTRSRSFVLSVRTVTPTAFADISTICPGDRTLSELTRQRCWFQPASLAAALAGESGEDAYWLVNCGPKDSLRSQSEGFLAALSLAADSSAATVEFWRLLACKDPASPSL